MSEVTIGSLFSGIGGLELGLEWAGLGPVLWQAEMDPYARRVLARHWPEVKRYERVEDVGADAADVDLICGGFPCQDISQAGRKAGLEGEKSGLWYEFRRIVEAKRPRFVVIENNGHRWRAWVPEVRRQLDALGYASEPLRLYASALGAWHKRDRCFVIADRHSQGLRVQPRGWPGAHGESAVLAARASAPWVAPNLDGQGELQPSWSIQDERGRTGDCGGRTIEPALARGVHGVSHRLDRERTLGNAVVPSVAEVIGRLVRRLADDNDRRIEG